MLIRKTLKWKLFELDLQGCPPRDFQDKVLKVEQKLADSEQKLADRPIFKGGLGRVLAVCIEDKFNLVGTYVPNSGSDRKNPLKHLDYRINKWDPALHDALDNLLKTGIPCVWMGDLNVAPFEIDVTDPLKMSEKDKFWAGFTPEERMSHINYLEKAGFVDVWRITHPDESRMSWQSKRSGMRLDHVLVKSFKQIEVVQAWIVHRTIASAHETDHVPIGIRLKLR